MLDVVLASTAAVAVSLDGRCVSSVSEVGLETLCILCICDPQTVYLPSRVVILDARGGDVAKWHCYSPKATLTEARAARNRHHCGRCQAAR